MFDANRYAWNLLAEKTSGKLFTSSLEEINNEIRPFVKKGNIDSSLAIFSCPEECFDSAYRDLLKARKTTMALSKAKKNKTGKGFVFPEQLKFKKKKEGGNSIEIRSRKLKYNYKERTIKITYKKFLGKDMAFNIKTDLKKLNLETFDYSCRLNMEFDHYFLNIPHIKKEEVTKTGRKCAIDPGVRTPLTGYDPDGLVFEMGKDNEHLRIKERDE